MLALLVAVAVALVVFGAAVALTRSGPELTPMPPDQPDLGLPERDLRSTDVELVGFGLAFRGYRMGEVDRALLRLQETLAAREAEIAQWQEWARREPGLAPEGARPWPNSS